MYDHIGLSVGDLDASVRFYGAALTTLGLTVYAQDTAGAGLGPKGEPALWLYKTTEGAKGTGTHIALRAPDRTAVDRFHQEGLKAGGRDNGLRSLSSRDPGGRRQRVHHGPARVPYRSGRSLAGGLPAALNVRGYGLKSAVRLRRSGQVSRVSSI